MKQIAYVDLQNISVEHTGEEQELMGLFREHRNDGLVMIHDGEGLRLIPKAAIWAKVRAGELEAELLQRQEAREQSRAERKARERRQMATDRKKKHREDRFRGILFGGLLWGTVLCAGLMLWRLGDPGKIMAAAGTALGFAFQREV